MFKLVGREGGVSILLQKLLTNSSSFLAVTRIFNVDLFLALQVYFSDMFFRIFSLLILN